MDKDKTFVLFFIISICFLCSGCPPQTSAKDLLSIRVLAQRNGSQIFYESSRDSIQLSAINLLNETRQKGWRSEKGRTFPHLIILELKDIAQIDLLKFNNNSHETLFPGISAREVRVEVSTAGPYTGYREVGNFILEKGRVHQEFQVDESKALWVRLSIMSNHGNPDYTELMEFEAWGTVSLKIFDLLSHFIWILGISIILTIFSYYAYLSQNKKTDLMRELRVGSLKKGFLTGLSLIAMGLVLSMKHLLFAAIAGLLTSIFMLYIIFKKNTKKQGC